MQVNSLESNRYLYVILNPAAGMIHPDHAGQQIRDWCAQNGWQCDIYLTAEDEDLAPVIASAVQNGYGIIAAVGGDGTVSAVAGGMVNCPVPLLIVPLGTGNLLARDMGVPFGLPRALQVLSAETTILMMDMMRVNHHYGVLNAGVGFSSLLIKNTPREEKRRLGFLAYLKSAVRAIFGLQPHHFRVSVDGGKPMRINASEIYIANGGLLGVQIPFEGLRVLPDDGRVDMFIIKARTLRDYLEILYYILRRKPRQAPKMQYIQSANTIRIESETKLPVQSDGEVIGETPVTIHVIPNAVKVLLPAKPPDDQLSLLRRMVGI